MIRTAGMCNGTPDWQLERMYETDTEKRLEEAYAEGFDDSTIKSEFSMASHYLGQAVDHLIRAKEGA